MAGRLLRPELSEEIPGLSRWSGYVHAFSKLAEYQIRMPSSSGHDPEVPCGATIAGIVTERGVQGSEVPASKVDDAWGHMQGMPSTLAQLDSRIHNKAEV